ncbi:cobalamin biosynthesis protein [Granulicella arctica]|uniref:cobalamin biosynthesis protein n=1 Tax=Granulicella arctica TaxID=940613 RepID=UPI0037BF1C34
MISAPQLAIGIGFSTRASSEDIIQLIRACTSATAPASIIASLDRRAVLAGLVAKTLGMPLMLFPASTLAQVSGISTRSALALKMTKTASVAEASALASLGTKARLIVPYRTGRYCTCAVAALPANGDE